MSHSKKKKKETQRCCGAFLPKTSFSENFGAKRSYKSLHCRDFYFVEARTIVTYLTSYYGYGFWYSFSQPIMVLKTLLK